MDIFRTMLIPTANVELARAIAESFGPGGENMWITPCSPDGKEPATYWVTSGYIPHEFAYLVPLQVWEWQQPEDGEGAWVMVASEPGDPVAVYNLAIEGGVQCTQDDVDDLFANADMTEQDNWVAMGRLGVQLVQLEGPI